MTPTVSIVINNYNYEQYLDRTIESALAQTYDAVETIVVDDGSTDASRSVIETYGSRVRSVFKENGGQASAMNAGFAASRGDFVLFLDADDALAPEAVERCLDAWSPGVAKVQFRLQCIDEDGQAIHGATKPPQDRPFPLPDASVEEQVLTTGKYVTPPTSGNLFDRSALETILPIPEDEWRICADAYLYLKSAFAGRIRSIDACHGYYRKHGENAWNDVSADPQLLRRRVRVNLKQQALVRAHAAQKGHALDSSFYPDLNFARDRLASFFLDPDAHPIASDTRHAVVRYSLRSVLKDHHAGWRRRGKLLVAYAVIGLVPTRIAQFILRAFLPGARG